MLSLIDAGRISSLRDFLRFFNKQIRRYFSALLNVNPKLLSAAVTFHFWHSSQPLDGLHFHAHVILPNVSAFHTRLSRSGAFPVHVLHEARAVFSMAIYSFLGFPLNLQEFVIHSSFLLGDADFPARLQHLTRYIARSPLQDLTKLYDSLSSGIFFDAGLSELLKLIDVFVKSKTLRFFGFLSPVLRKKFGLYRLAPAASQWEAVPGIFLTFLRVVGEFITFVAIDSSGRYELQFPSSLASHGPQSPPRLWGWGASGAG